MKKLLAIQGSPRNHGLTATMLDTAVKAANAMDWEVTTVRLYEKRIEYCRGCRACVDTRVCIIKDDLQQIAELVKQCDMVVLAAPTYWANVPAIVKNLFDRLLGIAMEETSTFPKPRLSSKQRYLLLTACNTPFPFSWIFGQSRGTLRAMEEFFRTSGMKKAGAVVCANAKSKTKVPDKVLEKIRRFW